VERGLDLTKWQDLVILILIVLIVAGLLFLLMPGFRKPPSSPDGK